MSFHLQIQSCIIVTLILCTFSFSQDINVKGTIFDSDSLTVGNAEVRLQNQDVSVISDSNGVFTLTSTNIKDNSNHLKNISQNAQLINNTLSITSTKQNQSLKIKAFNLQGKVVKEVKYENISMGVYNVNIANTLSSQSNGLYILKINIGKDQFIKRYLKRDNSNSIKNNSLNIKSAKLNRQSLVIDTIIINRINYKEKKIPINTYNIDLSTIYLDNDTNCIEINKNTKILNDTVATLIDENSTEEILIASKGNAYFDSLKVGDVIVSGPNEIYPNGVLKKIVAISDSTTIKTFKIENAALTDAIDNCNIIIKRSLEIDTTRERGVIKFAIDHKYSDHVEVYGNAENNVDFEFNLKIEKKWLVPVLKKLEFSMNSDVSVNVGFKYSIGKSVELDEIKLFDQPFAPILVQIGALPLYIQPAFQVHFGAKFDVSSEMNFDYNLNFKERCGVRYQTQYPIFQPFFDLPEITKSEFSCSELDNALKFTVDPYIKNSLILKFYNVVGPYGAINVNLKGTCAPLSNPWWSSTLGISPSIGLKLEVLNKTLLDTSFIPFDLGYEKLLAMAGPKGLTSSVEGDNIIVSWDDDYSDAELYTLYASKSALISTDNYDKKYQFTTTSCTLPISDFEIDNRWHFIVTAYNGTHNVESQSSRKSSVDIYTKDPIVDFTATPTSGTCSLNVMFTPEIEYGINTYDSLKWDFGDSTYSKESLPMHTYTSPGTYDVTLTVYFEDTIVSIKKDDFINVDSIPLTTEVDLICSSISGCIPLTVNFSLDIKNPPSDSFTCTYYFGDHNTSNLKAPSYTYLSDEKVMAYVNVFFENGDRYFDSVFIEPYFNVDINLSQNIYTKVPFNLTGSVSGGSSTALNVFYWQFNSRPSLVFQTQTIDTLIQEPIEIDGTNLIVRTNEDFIDTNIVRDIVVLDTIKYLSTVETGERDWHLKRPGKGGKPLRIFSHYNLLQSSGGQRGWYSTFKWAVNGETDTTTEPYLYTGITEPGIYTVSLIMEAPIYDDSVYKSTIIEKSENYTFEVYGKPTISSSDTTGEAPFTATITANDPHGCYDEFEWSINGETLSGSSITYTFETRGTFIISLIAYINDCPPGKKCEPNMPQQMTEAEKPLTIIVTDAIQ